MSADDRGNVAHQAREARTVCHEILRLLSEVERREAAATLDQLWAVRDQLKKGPGGSAVPARPVSPVPLLPPAMMYLGSSRIE